MNLTLKRFSLIVTSLTLIWFSVAAHAEGPTPQIRVSGQAEATMAPDIAVLQLTVMREATTARAALDDNSEAMAEVIAAMRQADVAESDLQTSNFSIQPRYT